MAVATGERGFITSDKVIHTTFELGASGDAISLVVWMPFSPLAGMMLAAEGVDGPVFRLNARDGQPGLLEVSGPPRAPGIKGGLEPLEMDGSQTDALTALVLAAAQRLFATDPRSIDAAFRVAINEYGIEPPFRYRPTVAG